MADTISKVKHGETAKDRTDAAHHLSELTDGIDPAQIDNSSLRNMVSLLHSYDDSVRFWVAGSLGNLGPRARAIASPTLLKLLPNAECLRGTVPYAPAIRTALTRMGVSVPPPACETPKYRYSDVDVPVSLAIGTVRTPEFTVKSEWYFVMIQIEKPVNPKTPEELLLMRQRVCMMGLTMGPLDVKDCGRNDLLLRVDWTVWDGDRMVQQGSDPDHCACRFENEHMYKIFGPFQGQAGKKYVVEMRFIKDASPLNLANPHLIVITVKNH